MSRFHSLSKRLSQIPHLDLGWKFDVPRLQQELRSLDESLFQPYRTTNPAIAVRIAECWQGVSLVSPRGSLHEDLTAEFRLNETDFQFTSLAEQCPYMKEIVHELGCETKRVRLMRIQPGSGLTWHVHGHFVPEQDRMKHKFTVRDDWHEAVVHVPIICPPEFSYEVIPLLHYQNIDFLTTKLEVHRKNYPEGEAWVFNSCHMHNVFNRSATEARYSLMLHLDIRLKKCFDIVSRAASRYVQDNEGPLLD